MIELLPTREVAVQIGWWSIRWYGIMYVLAFWLALWLLPRLATYRNLKLTFEDCLYIVTWGAAGALVGGRLGYVLFYGFSYFSAHLGQIFNLGTGGMSAHGGFIGVAVGVWWAAKRLKIDMWALADVIVVPAALGLALGRIGNFINLELYPGYWALVVAGADTLIGLLCWWALCDKKFKPGQVLAIFLMSYGVVRFANEFVRIQEWPLVLGLTRGQLLTIPVFLLGLYFWFKKARSLV